jgi:2-polyprenyl-3-methyl-5-hydroxy-6-metoxy-1,4-benzoquinol methylase
MSKLIKKLLRSLTIFFTSDFKEQNFLGNHLLPLVFKITPQKYKRGLALRTLGISPHYFICQHSNRYPKNISHNKILEREHQRNLSSRKEIYEKILEKYLCQQMIVLDFGCGPGYLAKFVAEKVKKVTAVDISCGVIECAKVLNNSHNIFYYINNGKDLSNINDCSLDLIYSFAVVQHLSDELFKGFLQEFFRVLKPNGKVICHIIIGDKRFEHSSFFKKNINLRFVERPENDVRDIIQDSGFIDVDFIPVKRIADLNDDDISKQHLFVSSKPQSIQ